MDNIIPAKISSIISAYDACLSEGQAYNVSQHLNEKGAEIVLSYITGQTEPSYSHKMIYKCEGEQFLELGLSDGLTSYINVCDSTLNFPELCDIVDIISKSKGKFSFLRLTIYEGITSSLHSNMVILNNKSRKVWIFDPNGSANINPVIHKVTGAYFKSVFDVIGYKYTAKKYEPIHAVGKNKGAQIGLCNIWCIFAVHSLHISQKTSIIDIISQLGTNIRGDIIYKYINFIDDISLALMD